MIGLGGGEMSHDDTKSKSGAGKDGRSHRSDGKNKSLMLLQPRNV